MTLTQKQIKTFHKVVFDYYRAHGRTYLPWRTSHITPYDILVSEIMLQQTQVERVIPKFHIFTKHFPTVESLAKAGQSDVIRLWNGLGYNRRARFLHQSAQRIVALHQGIVPHTLEELTMLPGIGPYTGAAIIAFAYNEPSVVVETNIRTVYIYHFFQDQDSTSDKELLPLIEVTLDRENPRQWYAALMDYGAHLKNTVGNLTKKSKTYAKQSKFEGSRRQVRGSILRYLAVKSPQTQTSLIKSIIKKNQVDKAKVIEVIEQLKKEGFVATSKSKIKLA